MVVRLFVVWIAVVPWLALSAYGREADSRESQARKACLTGKVEEGTGLLAELFAEIRDPNFVFNQARCYEQNGRFGDAVNRFREYLRIAGNITPSEKADVDRHIEECRALQAEQEKRPAAIEVAAPPAERSSSSLAPLAPGPPSALSTIEPNPASSVMPRALDLTAKPENGARRKPAPLYKTWWFWTGTAAVVAVGALTGILVFTRSSNACDGATMACRGVK